MRTHICSIAVALLMLPGAAFGQIVIHDPNYTRTEVASGLLNPQGVAADADGNLYIADSGNGRILKGPIGGPYTPLLTGIPVSLFAGTNIGPLGLIVAPDNTLVYGEGGGLTGVERVHHHTLAGALIADLPNVALGGNWQGLWVDAGSADRLLAISANGDCTFAFPRSGSTWGAPTLFYDNSADFVAPTGIVVANNTAYISYFGSFIGSGGVATVDPSNGTLLNDLFVSGIVGGCTHVGLLPDGRLVISEYGDAAANGRLHFVNALSGQTTLLATGISRCTTLGVGPDGSIYFSENGTLNAAVGKVHRLAPPAPPCPEDCSGDGERDQADLALLLSCYNGGPCCDINGDNVTDQADLAALLSVYNLPCN